MRRRTFASRGQSLPRRPRLELLETRLLLASGAALTTPDPATLAGINAAYGQFPMSFEVNQGQTDAQVSFLTRGPGYALFLTPSEAVLSLQAPAAPSPATGAVPQAAAGDDLRMQLIGANAAPSVVGLDQLPGTSNYLIGSDPSQWHTDVPNFARVQEQGVYPGVDLTYYGNQRQLEYDFTVAPGADPGVIRLAFQGADSTTMDAQGDLVLHTAGGDVVEQAPVLYQEVGGIRQAVSGHFVMGADGQVGFAVGAYDTSKPLVIDPTLSYSTYLGGNNDDIGLGIAVDAAGNAYIVGTTSSTNFPTASPIQPVLGGDGVGNAFVTKINAAGTALIYSTYLGGSTYPGNGDNSGAAIAVDAAGNAYVTGYTDSTNFPTTANAVQPASDGDRDAFVSKLNAAGTALVYSTYLGGSNLDEGDGIAVDASGDAYVTGFTDSTDFPTTTNSLQSALNGGAAFVTKLNAAGSGLVYSTYLGGAEGFGIAVDASGNAYITGVTDSADFPTVNPIQATIGGGLYPENAFVSKLNASGSALVYSTYLGDVYTLGFGIAVDASGDAYVTGITGSTDFPTVNPLQSDLNVNADHAFVSKLNATGSALVYSTLLGGSGEDEGFGIAVDASGNAYVTGSTSSSDFPTVDPTETFNGSEDNGFVSKLNASGSALLFSTYLGGGGGPDIGGHSRAIAVDASGDAFVTGLTNSSTFPTANPIQPALAVYYDAFVTKIAPGQALVASTTTLTAASNPSTVGQPVVFTATITVPQGAGVATGTVTFLEGTAVLGTGTLNGDGLATFSTLSLVAGSHTITAAYGGDTSSAASSSSPVDVTINGPALAPTTTTLTGAPSIADVGQFVTFTARVRTSFVSGTLIDDSVLFTIDEGASTSVPLQWVDGQDVATLTTSTLATGTHDVIASFGGDGTFAASTSLVAQVTINAAPTTTTLSVPQLTAMVGQPLSFEVFVSRPNSDPTLSPDLITGLVTFAIDGKAGAPVAIRDVNGQEVATMTTSTLAAGKHTVTASYAGNDTFASSVSNTVTATVDVPSPAPMPTTVATDGPLVMNFQRFGYHAQPTVLVLTFNKDLDPTTADNPANYKIVPLGPHGKFGPAIVIKRITYNAAAWTVTLHPSQRLNVHNRFELIVDGTSTHAVADRALQTLDGAKTGKAGSDYAGMIDWATLAGPSLPGSRYTKAWRKLIASGGVGHARTTPRPGDSP
jgi:Bacterial Ig-like domain (group 3)/Beta-propeller repeat